MTPGVWWSPDLREPVTTEQYRLIQTNGEIAKFLVRYAEHVDLQAIAERLRG